MHNPILTTRKTSTGKLISDLISAGIGIAVAFWLFKQIHKLESRWMFSEANTIEKLASVILVITLIDFLYHLMQFKTYADVYQERIVGKGIQKIALQSFDLRFDQIVDISRSKGFLNIESGNSVFLMVNTAGGSYKIVTKPDRANEIVEFYRKNKR